MKNKINALTTIVKEMGLSPEQVVHYWSQNGEIPQSCTSDLPEADIRTQTKLYWYYFANGKFSADANAYKGCLGVVGWINPNAYAPNGNKIYIVLRKQVSKEFSLVDNNIKVTDANDGYNNTQLILNQAREQQISFPAALYCNDILKLNNGISPFLPAKEQAICLAKNSDGIKKALAKIGGNFDGWIWTSSIFVPNNIWVVHTQTGDTDVRNRTSKTNITAIIAL